MKTHFVDLKQRAASKGELKRFMEHFGAERLVDRGSKRFRDMGLQTAHYGPQRWLDILSEEPLILTIPLVRWRGRLTVGVEQDEWSDWVSQGRG